MKFSQLALYYEKIEQTSSRLEITNLLAELFKKLTPEEIEKTTYLLQGRVLPLFEKTEFGMAERTIIKSIILALNLERGYFDKEYKKLGDLGKTVEQFKKQYASFEEKDLEVLEVYQELYRLATSSGDGSNDVKTSILTTLIRQLDALSCRYLVRIPQGIMRLGFSDMTVLDSLSWAIVGDKSLRPQIENAYHVRPDLGYIGRILKEKGIKGIKSIEPKVFTPIIMMRAERLSSGEEIVKQIGKCAIENKYDGFRLQVHCKRSQNSKLITHNLEVKLYSRNLEDVTYMYPDLVEGVKKQITADEVIFEGEAIGFNPQTKELLPFQETVQRKRKYDIEEKAKEIPLKLFIFEILFFEGVNYIHKPFNERRNKLEEIIKTDNNLLTQTVILSPQILTDDGIKIESLFDEAVSKNLEGIIAKKLDGVYQPGARGWNWIKFKKSYSAKIEDTIDCIVMGYDLGKGKRTDFGIGAFLVGIYDEKKEIFVTVAKIGTGLTDEEWRELQVKSQKLKVKSKPANYFVDKMMACDIWVTPKIVVEIKADEITKSPVHTAGLALRFPRLEHFRDDKKPEDTTSLNEVEKMYERQKV